MPSDIFNSSSIHPIDMVEEIAEMHEWNFDRVADDQISMAIEGQWRTYSLTVASGYQAQSDILRIVGTFEFQPPEENLSLVYELLNNINHRLWEMTFNYWPEEKLIVVRSAIPSDSNSVPSSDLIQSYINGTVYNAERFYPALQLTAWGDTPPSKAIGLATNTATGEGLRRN